MNAQEDMRQRLAAGGLNPTPFGEQWAEHEEGDMRRELHETIDKLSPRDLLSVWLVATSLIDEPQVAP